MSETLNKQYQLQELLAYERMTTVYRGYDLLLKRAVAIKVLDEDCRADRECVAYFRRVAQMTASLRHPGIVQTFEYGQSEGTPFMVMELVEGTTLRNYLRSHSMLAVDRAVAIARDVALALRAAHLQGIVHREVKPQHILMSHSGQSKLTNFGIAGLYQYNKDPELPDWPTDSVFYCAPEQAQGEIGSPAADVYALGIVLYEMLTGRPPFTAEKNAFAIMIKHIQDLPAPPSRLNPNVPADLEAVIMCCLEKLPERRFRTGNALAHALAKTSDSR